MSFTEHDVHECRRLMSACRVSQLAIGDMLAAAWADNAAALGEFCERVGLSVTTAKQWRATAKAVTADLRTLLETCGVFVSYSVLREGTRMMGGRSVDPGYAKLAHLAHRHRPGQPMVTPGLGDGAPAVHHTAPAGPPQPGGGPHPRADLRNLLGERSAPTAFLPAHPAAFVPQQADRLAAGVQVAGRGEHAFLDPGGEHPARRAGPCRLIIGDHVDHPMAVIVAFHPHHRHAFQAQQQRRIRRDLYSVVHARGFLKIGCLDNSHDPQEPRASCIRGDLQPCAVTQRDHRADSCRPSPVKLEDPHFFQGAGRIDRVP